MKEREFKYGEMMKSLEKPCPPENFASKETIAFRWVFGSMVDERNFLPQYFKNQKRFQNKPPEVLCKSIGLSFFSTEQNASERFKILTARMLKSVKNKLGENIAEGKLLEEDGVCDLPDEIGHFTLHPFNGSNLAGQFYIVAQLT